jgi:predicted dehydrogenase
MEMRHFIEFINTGAKPRSDGEAGLRVVRVLDEGMRSLRAGGARVAYRQEAESPEPARA